MKKNALVVLLMIATQVVMGQNPDLKVGQKTPDLVITDYILNTPKDKNFSNKFKVVEFWATWCGPCLGAVSHLNELQNKFKDNKNLVFISISDEAPEKINKTLSKIKFETIVVSDQTKKTHENLIMRKDKSYSIPATILIDDQNIVRFIGHPDMLTPDVLNKFISGQSLVPSEGKKETKEITKNAEPENKEVSPQDYTKIYKSDQINYAVIFSETNPKVIYNMSSYYDFENARLMFLNWDLKSILASLNGVPNYKIVLSNEVPNQNYDFMYTDSSLSNKEESYVIAVKSFLMNKLKLKESDVTVPTDVYLLKVTDAKKLKENENNSKEPSHSGSSKEFINFDCSSLERVSEVISSFYKIIVTNESNSNAKYNFLFKRGSLEELIKELNAYGLTLEKAQRNIDCIQYEK